MNDEANDSESDGPELGSIVEDGIGFAVSGGGYRATVFHIGAFWRLFEIGLLQKVNRISSVSGGSVTAAKVGLEWHRLTDMASFVALVVEPLRELAGVTIDIPSISAGVLLPGSVADRVSGYYAKYLFGDSTLQDLPEKPRFVINATNVETGTLWRFMKPYMGDYKVGRIMKPTTLLADAVTASSAFPPVLSPYVLDVTPDDFDIVEPGVPKSMLSEITLTDGGVYDNLGMQAIKRYRTMLVADAGGALAPDPSPPADWLRHTDRVIGIIHGQVSKLRKHQLIEAYTRGDRQGAYWGVTTNIDHYELSDALAVDFARSTELAETPTRLKRMDARLQERLINWGYAVCDAAVRKHYSPTSMPAPVLPYPGSGI